MIAGLHTEYRCLFTHAHLITSCIPPDIGLWHEPELHVARYQRTLLVRQIMLSHVTLFLSRAPAPTWKRQPGRLRAKWIDQSVPTTIVLLQTSRDSPLARSFDSPSRLRVNDDDEEL